MFQRNDTLYTQIASSIWLSVGHLFIPPKDLQIYKKFFRYGQGVSHTVKVTWNIERSLEHPQNWMKLAYN